MKSSEQQSSAFVKLHKCTISGNNSLFFRNFSWELLAGETWLITGNNGSGKSIFAEALSGCHDIEPEEDGFYFNSFSDSLSLVSFEKAAALIAEERKQDDSDFIDGGIDTGRTPRMLLEKVLADKSVLLETHPSVMLCGIESVLDRGLKYLSTGEIRRALLCCALVRKPSLLILDEPFEGLDLASRTVLSELLDKMRNDPKTHVLLLMDRYEHVPNGIDRVLELEHSSISFIGLREQYEAVLKNRRANESQSTQKTKDEISCFLNRTASLALSQESTKTDTPLIEMRNVTVEWSGRKVLDSLTWVLYPGAHWLIRGPNGSGKTTFLELITGDNPQVFRNDVFLFGKKRGSGETIWEIKEKLGIVSYKLHLEYRLVGDIDLEAVLLSGLHDSIGLYDTRQASEAARAEEWLSLGGFAGRGNEQFRNLSYGEQRAILILRAAIKCPPVLILDEPCHGLDDTHRNLVLALLQKIAEAGLSTLLHVTHDPTEVLPCEQHILELRPMEDPMYQIISLRK